MAKLEVIVADLENNCRQNMMEQINACKEGYFGLVKVIMGELKIYGDFEKFVLIKPDGEYSIATYENGIIYSHFDTFNPYPHFDTKEELERDVSKRVHHIFENPHVLEVDRRILGIKIGTTLVDMETDIYPYNTILIVDQRFEDAALRALEGLNIEANVHHDYTQPSLF